ncbi:unnamed protein product, partial [Durusdinium trenchii]
LKHQHTSSRRSKPMQKMSSPYQAGQSSSPWPAGGSPREMSQEAAGQLSDQQGDEQGDAKRLGSLLLTTGKFKGEFQGVSPAQGKFEHRLYLELRDAVKGQGMHLHQIKMQQKQTAATSSEEPTSPETSL